MRHEVSRAQVDALHEWARQWEADGCPGATEIAFLMRRAAQQIERILTDEAVLPEPPEPPAPATAEAVRDD